MNDTSHEVRVTVTREDNGSLVILIVGPPEFLKGEILDLRKLRPDCSVLLLIEEKMKSV